MPGLPSGNYTEGLSAESNARREILALGVRFWPRTCAAQTGRRLWRKALFFSDGGRPAELSGDFLEALFQRLAGIGKHLRTGCAQLLFRRCRDPRNHIARLVIELGDGRQNPGIGNVLQPAFVLTGGIVAYVLQVRAQFIPLLLAERLPRFQQRPKSGRNRLLRFANPAFERTGHSRLERPQEVFLLERQLARQRFARSQKLALRLR